MQVSERILQLREERGWSEYQLSVESGIPQSTISSWFRKNAQPSLKSLKSICDACGITMSQFFDEGEQLVNLTQLQRQLLQNFSCLSSEQQEALVKFLDTYKTR